MPDCLIGWLKELSDEQAKEMLTWLDDEAYVSDAISKLISETHPEAAESFASNEKE